MRYRSTLLGLLVVLAGCAAVPHVQAPQLSVGRVEFIDGNLREQHLRVQVHAHNPNGVDLPIRLIRYDLKLAGEPVAHGESEAPFVVPARGDGEFSMTVNAQLASAFIKLLPHLKDGGRGIDYEVDGTVLTRVLWLSEFPFHAAGRL